MWIKYLVLAADGPALAAIEIPSDREERKEAEPFCFLAIVRENYMMRLRSGR